MDCATRIKKTMLYHLKKAKINDVKWCIEPTKVNVNDEEIERVNTFEYLGSLIEADGDSRYTINHTEVGNGIKKMHKQVEATEGNKQQH